MQITNEQLEQLLVGPGHISKKDFTDSVEEAKAKDASVCDVLIDKGLIQDEQLGKLIADEKGIPFIRLTETVIDEKIFALIPELVARTKGVVAFGRDKNHVLVAMINPDDVETIGMIAKRTGLSVTPYLVTQQDLQTVFTRYTADIKGVLEKLLHELETTAQKEQQDDITVQVVDMLLRYGHENKASDIHIEPHAKVTLVRFRIDGVLHDVLELPKTISEQVLTRIKILARMRTDEHRSAQDGRFRFDVDETKVDVRVSMVPVSKGENVVMRLLSASTRGYALIDIGLNESDAKKIEHAVNASRGMILVTGPTGSGKTTSIYSMLKILNTRDVHISSIEDPIEYDIEGVSQIQVDVLTNLTFAVGLRAIVRQDPDIIFVGEIRDKETAGIAVNSALTGHLVLSTVHADDAATTPIRFLDMGIEPYLIAATVNIIIAQRLVRKICTSCRRSYEAKADDPQSAGERRLINDNADIQAALAKKGYKGFKGLRLYKGDGCGVCGNSGYHGRIGVFEVLVMSDPIRELITKSASRTKLTEAAKEQGMTTMFENGIEKILAGITTFDEVIRMVYE